MDVLPQPGQQTQVQRQSAGSVAQPGSRPGSGPAAGPAAGSPAGSPQVRPGTPSLLRELNDRAALDLLLAGEPLTRAQISERTGVSKVTVSQMLTRLEERGLVRIAGEQAGGRGPNAALYAVVPSSAYVAGLYLDLDVVTAAVSDVTGRSVADVSVDQNGTGDPVELVRGAVGRACASAGIELSLLSALVIGSPGVLDPRTGDPRLATNLPAWHEGVLDGLREVLHKPVFIENDVNLAAMAERSDGAAAGLDDFVMMWIGVGLGLATVIDGKVRRGVGGAAGEIGWMPVHGAPLPAGDKHPADSGLQSLVGGKAVLELAASYGFTGASAADVVRAAVSAEAGAGAAGSGSGAAGPGSAGAPGSGAASAFLDELALRVSLGAASVCVVLDPGLVVLGGAVGRAGGEALASRVGVEVPRMCLARPRVVPTAVPGEPVLRGATLSALAHARAALLASVADPQLSPIATRRAPAAVARTCSYAGFGSPEEATTVGTWSADR